MEPQFVRIPKERIAILIGKDGETKKTIEKHTKTEIGIDSQTGDIQITPKSEGDLDTLKARDIVKAIGRGFSPNHALVLLDDDYYLEVISLVDILGKSQKGILQKKGRIIGKKGSTRSAIEDGANCFLSVYGKTISVIGKPEGLEKATKAIQMLLDGAGHQTVYNYLNEKEETSFEL